ncbi:hypothetical protein ACP70R_015169 [Stipagrostis hirtigluma subsp. patula]
MAPRPPELMEELVEEVLLRFPPEDPASLARAALVCRGWRRIVSDPFFRRRFRELHGAAAPMLGFLCNLRDDDGVYVARFFPAAPFCRPQVDLLDRRALDARHGRVLLTGMPGSDLVVWDPVTDGWWQLPAPSLHRPWSWNAAVLCAAHGTCDHLDCHHGPFLVVFVDSDDAQMRVYVYSSEAAAWSEPIYGPQSPVYGVDMVPTALAGNALYFVIDASYSILEYDLATRKMCVIHLPKTSVDFAVLTTMEDGVLGFARVVESKLCLWSLEDDFDGDAEWTPTRVIQLETVLPVDALSITSDFVGFAHGVGLFFVGTADGLFTIDLKSGQVKMVSDEFCSDGGIHGVVPYTRFYIPEVNKVLLDGVRSLSVSAIEIVRRIPWPEVTLKQ